MFLEQGFEATSVAQITEAADVGKGTFFTYFRSKQAVFAHLSEQVTTVMVDAAAKDSAACSADRLRSAFEAAARWFDAHHDLARQMCIARLSTITQVEPSEFRDQLIDLLTGLLIDGIRRGEFRNVDPHCGVEALAAAYFMPVALWVLSEESSNHPDFAGHLDIVLAGLKEQ